MTKKGGEREIAQVVFEDDPFNRYPDGSPYPHRRIVRIIGSYRPKSGTISFRPAHKSPTVPSDFPHLSFTQAEMYDVAEVSRSLQTARKDGASSSGVDVEDEFIKRGGIGHRPQKYPQSFGSQTEFRKIKRIRKIKGSRVK